MAEVCFLSTNFPEIFGYSLHMNTSRRWYSVKAENPSGFYTLLEWIISIPQNFSKMENQKSKSPKRRKKYIYIFNIDYNIKVLHSSFKLLFLTLNIYFQRFFPWFHGNHFLGDIIFGEKTILSPAFSIPEIVFEKPLEQNIGSKSPFSSFWRSSLKGLICNSKTA